jgi:hypothetical protein
MAEGLDLVLRIDGNLQRRFGEDVRVNSYRRCRGKQDRRTRGDYGRTLPHLHRHDFPKSVWPEYRSKGGENGTFAKLYPLPSFCFIQRAR